MELKESSVELSIEEGVALGMPKDIESRMPKDIGTFGKIILSHEALVDITVINKSLTSIKLPNPPSEQEIKDWQKSKEYLDNLDWEEARKRVQIFSRQGNDGEDFYDFS